MKKLRVPLPMRRPNEMLDLAKKVLDKHLADGTDTKLNLVDWQKLQPAIEQAIALHQEAEQHRTLTLQRMQDRDLLMKEVIDGVQNCRDILTGTFKKDMKKLGSWGFNVVESVARKKVSDTQVAEKQPVAAVTS